VRWNRWLERSFADHSCNKTPNTPLRRHPK
jgi:hypothetical protein